MISIPVLLVSQPIGDFFVASMPAKELVQISYSDIRRLPEEQRDVETYLGIQRPLSKSRVREIRDYLQEVDATFPTSIILSVDERCCEYSADDGRLIISPYEAVDDLEQSIPLNRIAKVLDGQHRIAGLLEADEDLVISQHVESMQLSVSIFIGIDLSEQANIFATVNLAQTKVNKSLVYDLSSLARSRSPFKSAHNVAVILDSYESSPFFKRIKRLGVATPGRRFEPITQAAFVEALLPMISQDPRRDRRDLMAGRTLSKVGMDELKFVPFRNLFVTEQESAIAEILFNYFSAVRRRWPIAWEEISRSGNLLPKSNSFKAFMRYLRNDVYPDIANGLGNKVAAYEYVPAEKEFLPYLAKVELTDQHFTRERFAPGSGGQSTFYKLLVGEISAEDILANGDE